MKERVDKLLERIWGFNKLYIDYSEPKSLGCDEAGIILATNPANYERFASLDSFKEIFKKADLELNLYNLQLLQASTIFSVNALKIKRDELLSVLKILSKENLCAFSHYELISEFLASLKLDEISAKSELNRGFQASLASLNELSDTLCKYFSKNSEHALFSRLKIARQNANSSRFFVAFTGVINAGKSSTLNALMGQNILGVSNIPETASISVLSYGDKEKAKIEFWPKSLHEQMGLKPKDLASLELSLDELKNYTGASSELSRYIKQSELFLSLEILRDGLSIVDTPGLDDAVIWREELTKSYINKCDYILHLMNAAQASSKKDMLFIIDTLKNAKSSAFGVVLTHIDELKPSELDDALAYTKSSIKAELKECGFDESLADEVKFFKLSAPKNIGVDELKAHLYESFFGANSKKAQVILQNYKKELGLIINALLNEANEALNVLTSDNKEQKINELLEQKQGILNAQNDINARLEATFSSLIKDLKPSSELASICATLSSRIIADIRYAKDKGAKINYERIAVISQSGINDMLLDLARDSRAKLDLSAIFEDIKLRFNLQSLPFEAFDVKSYFEQNAPRPNYSALNEALKEAIKKTSDLARLDVELSKLLNDFIAGCNPNKLIADLLASAASEFKAKINALLANLQESLSQKSEHLQALLDEALKDKERQNELKEQKINEIKALSELARKVKSC